MIEAELGKSCWMSHCRNNKRLKVNNKQMLMFKFPKNEKLSDFWLAICNKPFTCPFHGQRICQDHFEESDMDTVQQDDGSSVLVLRGDTIPKLFVPNISQGILEEFWHQKQLGLEPVLKSISIDYLHKKTAILEECMGLGKAAAAAGAKDKQANCAKGSGSGNSQQTNANSKNG